MAAKLAPQIAALLAEPPDERRLGQFYLGEQVGKGSFAPVFLAHERLGVRALRDVAVKLFAVAGGKGADAAIQSEILRERIVEEAQALVAVEHPNIVRFYTIATNEKHGVIALVMEYVHGESLDRLVESFASRPPARRISDLLDVGGALASALSAMHQRDLLHRDIKPANVIESAGVYKLIDFGIAAAARRAAPSGGTAVVVDGVPLLVSPERARELGQTGTSGSGDLAEGGTPGYQDPACLAKHEEPTPRSDLYALGAMLFQLATGCVPAVYANRLLQTAGLCEDVLLGAVAAPSVAPAAAFLPPALAKLIDALLERDPEKRPRSAEVVAWELERIRAEIAGRARARPPEEEGPFRGLARFEQSHRDVYFGRTAEIATGVQLLRARSVLAIVGPSGSGKSSLARAGILPAVSEGALGKVPKAWTRVILNPGSDPQGALASALAEHVPGAQGMDPERLIAALVDRAQSSDAGIAILVDQLEEVVTLASGESQAYVLRFLSRLDAQPLFGVRVIVAARQDLLPDLLRFRDTLGRVLTRDTQLVAPLSDRMWSEVLDQALDAYGYSLEDDALRDRLLHELEGAAMPLVQFALAKLWERRDRERKIIPRAALDAIGGIAGALDVHGEATYERIAAKDPEAGAALRSVLLALTTSKNTRATRTLEELKKRVPHRVTGFVVAELEAARLVSHEDAGLTLAHEALLVQWARLRGWLAEAHEDRLLADEIERDAEGWKAAPEEERLWKKRRLIAAEDLLRRGNETLTDEARAFVRAGRAAARRGLVTLLSLSAALTMAIVVATAWQLHNLRAARDAQAAKAAEAEQATLRAQKAEGDAVQARDEAVAAKNDAEARLRERNECMDAKNELAEEERKLSEQESRASEAEKRAEESARSAAQIRDEKEQQASRLKQECAAQIAACNAQHNQ